MSYFHVCPYCGAHLDPGEKCDCRKEQFYLICERFSPITSSTAPCCAVCGYHGACEKESVAPKMPLAVYTAGAGKESKA